MQEKEVNDSVNQPLIIKIDKFFPDEPITEGQKVRLNHVLLCEIARIQQEWDLKRSISEQSARLNVSLRRCKRQNYIIGGLLALDLMGLFALVFHLMTRV